MKKFFVLSVVILAVLFVSCDTGGTDSSPTFTLSDEDLVQVYNGVLEYKEGIEGLTEDMSENPQIYSNFPIDTGTYLNGLLTFTNNTFISFDLEITSSDATQHLVGSEEYNPSTSTFDINYTTFEDSGIDVAITSLTLSITVDENDNITINSFTINGESFKEQYMAYYNGNTRTLAVSAGVEGSSVSRSSRNARSISVYSMVDDTYFKDNRKEANRGSLLYQLTPESFILDIDDIVLYNEIGEDDYSSVEILERTMNPDGAIIPKHIDLAYADDFIRDTEIFGSTFDGLSMQFLPHGNGSSNDGYYVRSITGLVLPSEYNSHYFDGEVTDSIDGLPSELRYFSFESLQPIETNSGFLSYLTIGANVTQDGIQNPAGDTGTFINPVTETSGNSVSLYYSNDSYLDLSSYSNPEILFNWNLVDLVEIYDGGTPSDYSDDIITFCLSNPFPVSLTLQENTSASGTSGADSTAPSDVVAPAISGSTTYNTLQWINPRDEDLKEIVVTRKAGSEPRSRDDGEEVYRGYQPNYVDAEGIAGTDYYYLIQTVDYNENYSDGIVLDQIQP